MLNIITRCTRPDNLLQILQTIPTDLEIKWWIIFDLNEVSTINFSILEQLDKNWIKLIYKKSLHGSYGFDLINGIIDEISSQWIWILDDDNLVHENFSDIKPFLDSSKRIIVFNQRVDGKDFTKLDVRKAIPENMKKGGVDVAQCLFYSDIFSLKKFELNYCGDGELIEELYLKYKSLFLFIDKELCYYNKIQTKLNSNPKILVVGLEEQKLESNFISQYESRELNCKFIDNDTKIISEINNFNPDCIVTTGNDWAKYSILSNLSLDIRKRWIHENSNIGELAWVCANSYILNSCDKTTPLISFFTSIYNTGEKLWRTYESVKNQTYTNWEWVIVNDSNNSETLIIAEKIAELDCRVQIYDFKKKSGGIVGEAKYRAAALCKGEWIIELDHDDYVLPEACHWVVEGAKNYTDVKFIYSDCSEVYETGGCIDYGAGFSFGYGSYRTEWFANKEYKVINSMNINPKTIRHIVGVPNHFRAWEKKFYLQIGGHNRRLTIADDYELLVRTFLETRMLRIPKLLYLQFYDGNNTQDKTRADIQRRVRAISNHYNQKIYERFLELGKQDWAYVTNKFNPLSVVSRFGDAEEPVNYIYNEIKTNFEYNTNVKWVL